MSQYTLGRLPLPSLKRTITSLLLPEPLPVVSLVCFPAPSTIVNCTFKCPCNVLYTRVELLPSMAEPVSAGEFVEMHQEHRFFLLFFFFRFSWLLSMYLFRVFAISYVLSAPVIYTANLSHLAGGKNKFMSLLLM